MTTLQLPFDAPVPSVDEVLARTCAPVAPRPRRSRQKAPEQGWMTLPQGDRPWKARANAPLAR